MDINKVWLSGLAVSQPVLTKLSSRTPFASFVLQVNEKFVDKHNQSTLKPNLVRIESLGRSAEIAVDRVRQGQRYMVDGYLRQDHRDGSDEVRVRTFAVYKEESNDSVFYNQGLKQALELLKRSRDLKSAIESMEGLLAAT